MNDNEIKSINDTKEKVLAGLFWTFGERILAQGVSFILSIILARILLPSEYGIIAMVMVFINIANVFTSTGFGEALVQKKDADELDFSYTTFDLNAVLRSVAVSFFKSFEERKIIPVLSIAEISFPFYGDEKAVTRIFENIISNALSHGKSDYRFSSYDDNENYHFSFQNFTDSINESDIDKIFNRFYTTDLSRSRKTTGLGLTIAKNLTVKMGGSISASLNNNVFEIVVCFPKQKG